MIISMAPNKQNFSHQWRTSIQSGIKGGEKRSALFTWPRVSITTNYAFTAYSKYSWMKKALYKYLHDIWEIPLWYDRTALTALASAGQAILAVGNTDNRHFYAGRDCIIINDTYEKGTISSIDSNTQITLSDNLTNNWSAGSLVLPLYKFHISPAQEVERRPNNIIQLISFDATEEFETARSFSYSLPSSGLETYLGHDLLLTPSKIPSITSHYNHPYDVLQMLGLGYSATHYDETELGLGLFFAFNNKQDSWDFLKIFDSKMGRFNTFWIPSWNKDIIVTEAILSTDTILTVIDLDYDSFYLPNDIINRHIWIRFPDKSYVCRKIISTPANNTIELDSAIGTAVAADNLSSMLISFLIFSRFNADEISFANSVSNSNRVTTKLKTKGLVEEAL